MVVESGGVMLLSFSAYEEQLITYRHCRILSTMRVGAKSDQMMVR